MKLKELLEKVYFKKQTNVEIYIDFDLIDEGSVHFLLLNCKYLDYEIEKIYVKEDFLIIDILVN